MQEVPMLRVELEGIKRSIKGALIASQDEINKMIEATIEETLTEQWVQEHITREVRQAIRDTISDGIDNAEIVGTVSNLIDQIEVSVEVEREGGTENA